MKRIAFKLPIFSLFLLIVWIGACKKGSNESDNNTTPTPKPTKGQAIIFLKQDCNVGNVTVTINNDSKTIRNYSSYNPGCDGVDSSYAVFSLDPGSYSVRATGGNLTWNSNVSVTTNQCTSLQLTCDNVTPVLKGNAGYPRFNLQHSTGVDFDLHVVTPDNTEINSFNTSGQGGQMDLSSSCLGSDSNYGTTGLTLTNENVWFPIGSAPHGTYKFWVVFYGTCSNSYSGSYTLRFLNGLSTVETYSGTLNSTTTKSQIYTITY